MLAYVSSYYGLFFGLVGDFVYYYFYMDLFVFGRGYIVLDYFFFFFCVYFFKLGDLFGVLFFFDYREQFFQCFFCVGKYGDICWYIFVDFRRIDFDVDDFGLFGIFFQIVCYLVIEVYVDCNEYIVVVLYYIGCVIVVYVQYIYMQRVVVGNIVQFVDGVCQWNI